MDIKIELSKNKKPKPDSKTLQFGKVFTDHMFLMDYTKGQGWHDAKIVPYAPLEMEPSSMVFHYGQSVFEGLKAYRTKKGTINLFRPEENFKRLNISDERMCIPYIDEDFALKALIELLKIDQDWVPSEEGTSLYIRPFVFATEPVIGVKLSTNYRFMIILTPVGSYYKDGLNPVKIAIEDELVRAVQGGTGFTKAAANYAISMKSLEKCEKIGASQVLWLDGVHRKYIEEVGAMNIFFKIDGKLVTPSLEGSILSGVTRDSVIKMAKSWGIEVEERRISVDELFESYKTGKLEEIFGTGTAAVISPVGSLIWKSETIIVNDNKIGEVSQKLYDELTGIQWGKIEDKFNWTIEVK